MDMPESAKAALKDLDQRQRYLNMLEVRLINDAIKLLASEVQRLFPEARALVLDTESDHGYRWYFLGGIYTEVDNQGEVRGDPIELDDADDDHLREIITFISVEDAGWMTISIPNGEGTTHGY